LKSFSPPPPSFSAPLMWCIMYNLPFTLLIWLYFNCNLDSFLLVYFFFVHFYSLFFCSYMEFCLSHCYALFIWICYLNFLTVKTHRSIHLTLFIVKFVCVNFWRYLLFVGLLYMNLHYLWLWVYYEQAIIGLGILIKKNSNLRWNHWQNQYFIGNFTGMFLTIQELLVKLTENVIIRWQNHQ